MLQNAFDDLLEDLDPEMALEEHRVARNQKWRERCAERPTGNMIDIFGTSHAKPLDKSYTCQICSRPVSVLKFAPHLEACMGKGRSRGRRNKSEAPTSLSFLPSSSNFPVSPNPASPYPQRTASTRVVSSLASRVLT